MLKAPKNFQADPPITQWESPEDPIRHPEEVNPQKKRNYQ
jgi:hypothetical protein